MDENTKEFGGYTLKRDVYGNVKITPSASSSYAENGVMLQRADMEEIVTFLYLTLLEIEG